MDDPLTTHLDKSRYMSGAVGTRAFENPWPFIPNHQQQLNPSSLPTFDMDNREYKVSNSLKSKPSPAGIGRGITRFVGNDPTLFPPGPQKSHFSKNLSPKIQGTNLKPHSTTPALELVPQRLMATSLFGQLRTEEGQVASSGHENRMDDKKGFFDSDSDSDGGVTLAMSLAVFLQDPGIVKLPLRPAALNSDTLQQRNLETQKPRQQIPRQDLNKQKILATKNPLTRSQPSLASRMAAVLQSPGVVTFTSCGPSNSSTTISHFIPASNTTSVALRGETNGEGLEAVEEKGVEEVHDPGLEVAAKPCESHSDLRSPLPVDEYADTNCYWRTPNTPFIYPRSAPQISTPITQQQTTLRKFHHWKDGDVIGQDVCELPKENKGRQIMERMGYKEGNTLGVKGNGGLIEPVKVEVRFGKRGLGLRKEENERVERLGQTERVQKALKIERVMQMEETIEIERATQISSAQMNITQQIPVHTINEPRGSRAGDEISPGWQLRQVGHIEPSHFVRYTTTTPYGAYKIREKMLEILAQLDSFKLLDLSDFNSVLWACTNKVVVDEKHSRFGFLVEAELVKIVRREYMQNVLRKDKNAEVGGY